MKWGSIMLRFSILLYSLCGLATGLRAIPVDSSFQALQDSLANATPADLPEVWNDLALYYLQQQEIDSSMHYAQQALEMGLKSQNKNAVKRAYWFLGRAVFFEEQYERTIEYMEKSDEVSIQTRDTVRRIKVANTMGLAYKAMGQYEKSVEAYQRGLQLARGLSDPYFQSLLCINLGVTFKILGSEDLALQYYRESERWNEANPDTLHQIIILINIANIYSSRLEFDSARMYFMKAEQLNVTTNDIDQLSMIYANLTHVDLRQNRLESALYYGYKVLGIADTVAIRGDGMIVALINMGEAYLRLNNLEQAGSFVNRAEQFAFEKNLPHMILEVYKVKSEYYEAMGQYDMALEYLRNHLALSDSLFSRDILQKTTRSESEVILSRKEKEIASLEENSLLQQSQNENLRAWLIVALVSLLSSIGILYIYLLRQKAQRLAFRQQAAENKLEALRNQMNPHFLFNSFNAIQHYILKSEKQNAYHYLTQFAHLLRMILDNASEMTIDLQKELDLLRSYVQLEALRFQDKFSYDFQVPRELLENNPTIPSMIIQPYIENAILHGLSNRANGEGHLEVHFAWTEDQRIRCTIEDNGIGRAKALLIKQEKEKHNPRSSIAMNNTSRRLQILEKAGYPKGGVVIEDLYDENGLPAGTRVVVELNSL